MALIYPFVLIAVAIAVVSALMIFVVPELVAFLRIPKSLPPLTVGLIWVSDFMRDYAWICLISMGVFVWSCRRALRHPGRRKRWHQMLLSVPGLRVF